MERSFYELCYFFYNLENVNVIQYNVIKLVMSFLRKTFTFHQQYNMVVKW